MAPKPARRQVQPRRVLAARPAVELGKITTNIRIGRDLALPTQAGKRRVLVVPHPVATALVVLRPVATVPVDQVARVVPVVPVAQVVLAVADIAVVLAAVPAAADNIDLYRVWNMRVLIVEDNRPLGKQIAEALRVAGYVAEVSTDGEDALFRGRTEPFDAIILDLGLPQLDGLSILQKWRSDGNKVPVIILTARDSWMEKVRGLRAGADDYVTKPFQVEEVLARIEALIRRSHGLARPVLTWGDVMVDTTAGIVTLAGRTIALTALEYRLLSYLMHRCDVIVSKTELTEHIYDQSFDRDSNVIEVLVNRLRKKLGVELIKTRRGLGYVISTEGVSGALPPRPADTTLQPGS